MEEWTLTQVATPAGSRKQLRDAVNDESQTATDFLWLLRKRIGIEYVDFYIDSLIGVIDTVAGWRPYSSYDYPTWAVPPECHFCFKTENSAELIHEIVPRFFP